MAQKRTSRTSDKGGSLTLSSVLPCSKNCGMNHRALVAGLFGAFLIAAPGCSQESDLEPSANAHRDSRHAALVGKAQQRGPRACNEDFKFMAASAALGGASEQIKLKDYRRANLRLRDGLEALGQVPVSSGVIDDRGQRLSFAWSEEWHGRLQSAAEVRQKILSSLLEDYAHINNLQGCPSPADAAEMDLPLSP